jgi:hypothetical protein
MSEDKEKSKTILIITDGTDEGRFIYDPFNCCEHGYAHGELCPACDYIDEHIWGI